VIIFLIFLALLLALGADVIERFTNILLIMAVLAALGFFLLMVWGLLLLWPPLKWACIPPLCMWALYSSGPLLLRIAIGFTNLFREKKLFNDHGNPFSS